MFRRVLFLLALFCPALATLADAPKLVLEHRDGSLWVKVDAPDTAHVKWCGTPTVQSDGTICGRLLWIDKSGWPDSCEYRVKLTADVVINPTPVPVIPPQPVPVVPPVVPPTPPPTPPPVPDDKPKPPLVPIISTIPAGRLLFVGVLNSIVAQTDVQAAIETSTELRKLVESPRDSNFRWLDKEITGPALMDLYNRAAKDGLPRVLIVNLDTRAVVDSHPMTDVAAAIALVRKWGTK